MSPMRRDLGCIYETTEDIPHRCGSHQTVSETPAFLQALKVTTYNIPFHAPGDANQRNVLHYYYSYAAADLAGSMTVGFWDCVVLQKIQTESVVRNAAIALSQAHFERVCVDQNDQRVSLYPTEAYTKAVASLRRYIRLKGRSSREVVLVCCVLFHTIELLRENAEDAKLQVENGIAILKAWQLETACDPTSATDSSEHMYDITTMLGRLDFSATVDSFGSRMPQLDHLDSYKSQVSAKTARLELRNARDAHTLKVHNAVDRWKYLTHFAAYRDLPISQVPSSIVLAKSRLEERHRATDIAVSGLLSSSRTPASSSSNSSKDTDTIKAKKTLY